MDFLSIIIISYLLAFVFTLLRETTFSMVFSLIIVFIIACLFLFKINFVFLGFMILIIYIGAIAVLFLFMVMLFDRTEYKKQQKFEKSSKLKICGLAFFGFSLITFLFFNVMVLDFYNFDFNTFTLKSNLFKNISEKILHNTGGITMPVDLIQKHADRVFPENGQNQQSVAGAGLGKFFGHLDYVTFYCSDVWVIGSVLYKKYFILLIMSGFGLLVAMMGCILITKSSFMDKFNRKNQKIEKQLSRFKI